MKKPRPQKLQGSTYSMKTGCGMLYITINDDQEGMFELFSSLGKSGGCASSQIESISRLISLSLRSGVDPKQIIKQLIGISCHQFIKAEENSVMSCADAIAKIIKLHLEQKEVQNG